MSYLLSFGDGRATLPHTSFAAALRAGLAETAQGWTIGDVSEKSVIVLASCIDGTPHIADAGLELLEATGETELAHEISRA